MRVTVTFNQTPQAVTLDDCEDFTRFHVLIVGGSVAAARKALKPYGRLIDDRSAIISIDAITGLSGRAGDPVWLSGLESMIFHADEAGWIYGQNSGIRGHCEWLAADGPGLLEPDDVASGS